MKVKTETKIEYSTCEERFLIEQKLKTDRGELRSIVLLDVSEVELMLETAKEQTIEQNEENDMDIYDNDFIREGDLIELRWNTEHSYVVKVVANPVWMADLVCFFGTQKLWVYDGQYKTQSENKEIKELRDSIERVYRANEQGNYIVIWQKQES